MAEKLDPREVVTQEELLMSQVITLDAVTQLLIEKAIITQDEFFTKIKQVQQEYQSKRESVS